MGRPARLGVRGVLCRNAAVAQAGVGAAGAQEAGDRELRVAEASGAVEPAGAGPAGTVGALGAGRESWEIGTSGGEWTPEQRGA